MNDLPCFCGCRERVVTGHHCLYQQHLRALAKDKAHEFLLVNDLRGIVPVAERCHARHHSRIKPYELGMLPDSVFEFAAETMGAPLAFNYLRTRYAGFDRRHDLLLEDVAA